MELMAASQQQVTPDRSKTTTRREMHNKTETTMKPSKLPIRLTWLRPAASLLLLLLLLSLSQQGHSATPKNRCPPERERQMRECARQISFLGDHSFKVPKNLTSVNPFCSDLNKSVNCIQSYTRECLTGFTRQLLGNLMKRSKQQHSLICSSKASRLDFISKMSCLDDDRIGRFHTLVDASITRFEYIASSQVEVDARLHAICCSYQIFFRDLESTLDRLCGKPAERKGSTNEYVEKIVGGTAGELTNVICENHRSIEECRASKVASGILASLEQLTEKVYAGRLAPKSNSLIPLLLEILDSTA